MSGDGRIQVAVLGGGLGGMSAAYTLSSTPERRQKYAVTVYQQGWRLGGKAASGRDPDKGDRILEHGLHMLMGFYENTFKTVRELYDAWDKTPDNPFQSWEDAFKPRNRVTFQEDIDGEWHTWNLLLPPRPGTPGDGGAPWDPWMYAQRLLGWLLETLHDALGDALSPFAGFGSNWPEWLSQRLEGLGELIALPAALTVAALPPAVTAIWQLIDLAATPGEEAELNSLDGVTLLVDELLEWLDIVFEPLDLDDFLRRIYIIARLGFATVRGLVVDVLPYGKAGWNRINDEDMKEWLKRHGANTPELYFSAPIQALYDLAFAWMNGRTTNPDDAQVAAGTGIKALLDMGLAYKGAPLWEMMAGMGDTIFSPFYEVCKANGVTFEFFHRVKNLGLSDTKRSIANIELIRQADIKPDSNGVKEYSPLYPVKGLPCWPARPFWDQLENGQHLKTQGVDFESYWCDEHVGTRLLEHGKDFDMVVLAIPPGAHPIVASELIEHNDAFRSMVNNVPTVATAAVQLWLEPKLEQMGWESGTTVMTTYVHPLESWGEMSHLLGTENWPASKPQPHAIEYFCGALEAPAVLPSAGNPSYPQDQKNRVKDIAVDWLETNVRHIWPGVAEAGSDGIDWDKLIDWDGNTGQARFDFQYWRANVDPSERYVLSPPGSIKFRLESGKSGFYNLVLAGDWVVTEINGGSAESAVEGGIQAGQAILDRS